MWIVSFIGGVLSIMWGVLVLRRTFSNGIYQPSEAVDLQEVNASFYDISNDLEGKYSIHEKQISDLEKQVSQLQQLFKKNEKGQLQQELVTSSVKIYEKTPAKEKKIITDIINLQKKGYSKQDIAQKLNIGIAELNLLLQMANTDGH